ncbi:SDR family oxidoreductase [Streptomyces sp. NPDC004542]|uniref:SDR family NAD(P)-dependent oxidoreductase n=1 Tax=Streptomyces sp. NPDC004542 TaxID=3154281 RepID=UPI0033A9A97B
MTPGNRHVVVTGAAGKIGTAIAEVFARSGDRVTGVDFRKDALEAAFAPLSGSTLVADLTDPDASASFVDEAWDGIGPVDVLVNCAALVPSTPFLEMTADMWDRVQAVNVRAPMLATAALGRRARSEGRPASVVNISSGAATRARPGASHYCTSKAAVEMLTRAAAVELGPDIRVNAVSPGFVDVDSPVNPVTPEYAELVSPNPARRRGKPLDIARAVFWIAGPEADFCTGSILRVDGGSTAGTTQLPLQWAADRQAASA